MPPTRVTSAMKMRLNKRRRLALFAAALESDSSDSDSDSDDNDDEVFLLWYLHLTKQLSLKFDRGAIVSEGIRNTRSDQADLPLLKWQWPGDVDPAEQRRLDDILVTQLAATNPEMAGYGEIATVQAEYCAPLLAMEEFRRPGYKAPSLNAIIMRVKHLINTRISELKAGTQTGYQGAQSNDTLDLACEHVMEFRNANALPKEARKRKADDNEAGNAHQDQAFKTYMGNYQVIDVAGGSGDSTPDEQSRKTQRRSSTQATIMGADQDAEVTALFKAKRELAEARARSEPERAAARRVQAEANLMMIQMMQHILAARAAAPF